MANARITAIIISFLGAILYSSKAIFVKLAYQVEPIDSNALLTLRMLFTLPFYSFSHFYRHRAAPKIESRIIKGAITAGFLFYLSAWLDFRGLQFISAGTERLILFLYPSFVLLISFIFYKQKVYWYQIIGLILTYCGITFAFWEEAGLQNLSEQFINGTILIFLCSITYGIYVVQNGIYLQNIGTERFTNLTMFSMSIFALIVFLIQNDYRILFLFQPMTYLIAIGMAVFATVIPSYLMNYGIKRIGATDAAIVNSIGPLSTILQAYFILGEHIGIFQIIGTCCVMLGIYWVGKK